MAENMLARICNWNYSWIAKNLDEPPPVLSAVKCKGSPLPELTTTPVQIAYNSIAQYQDVLFPLMLHEIWGLICKDVQNTDSVWRVKAIIHENVSREDVSTFVHCEAPVLEASPCLQEYDLVVLSFAVNKEQTVQVFAVVESVSLGTYDGSKDYKRLDLGFPTPRVCVNLTLRMKPSSVPEDRSRISVEIRRVTSLRTHVRQFTTLVELPHSPLHDAIIDPIEQSKPFALIEEASVSQPLEMSYMAQLNENQQKVVTSFSETVLKTGKYVPKVAMLQGPPVLCREEKIAKNFDLCSFDPFPRPNSLKAQLMNTVDYKLNKFTAVRVGDSSPTNPNIEEIDLETLVKPEHERLVAERKSYITGLIEMMETELKTLEKIKHDLRSIHSEAIKSRSQVYADYFERDIQTRVERAEESKLRLEKELELPLRHELLSVKEAIIRRANVICTTLNSCRNKDMENCFLQCIDRELNPKILCCIIDDASQCIEPESLTPLGLGISKLVLIGDPNQLKATVCSQYAQGLRFDQSLFNRFLLARTRSMVGSAMMLNTQYRMASSICTWPSKYFYGDKLVTDPSIVRYGPGELAEIICNYKVLNVHDGSEVNHSSDGNAWSIVNRHEAKIVARIIQALAVIEPNIHKYVSVISFNEPQKNCIIGTLRESGSSDVEGNTVEGFQGEERDIVLVSCVPANGDAGLLGSLQRMNVALTRARHSMIVVGHFDTLVTHEAWCHLIADAKIRNVYHEITSDCDSKAIANLVFKNAI